MYYYVNITTKKYHYTGHKFASLPEAWDYMKNNFSHSMGTVIRDGSTGRRFCYAKLKTMQGGH